MFGQYSANYAGRKTKTEMVEAARRRHAGSAIGCAKKIANNTIIYNTPQDGIVRVALHNTDILTMHPDGKVDIDTGGFNTVTTRSRIHGTVWHGQRMSCYTRGGVLHINGVPCHRRATVLPDGTVRPDKQAPGLDKLKS